MRLTKSVYLVLSFVLTGLVLPAAFGASLITNAPSGIRLRSGPTTNGTTVLDTLAMNTRVELVERSSNGKWLKVNVNGQTGWISAKWAEPSQSQAVAPPVQPAAPSSNGNDVLFIGDSHSAGCFGTHLDNALRSFVPPGQSAPLKVNSVATCGTSTSSWIKGPNKTSCGMRTCAPAQITCDVNGPKSGTSKLLPAQLKETKPRLTIVALGTNDLYHKSKPMVKEMVREILNNGSQCLWVGPPQLGSSFMNIATYESFVANLKAEVQNAGCTFVDSNKYSNRVNFGNQSEYHYGCKSAGKWADDAFAGQIKANLNSFFAPPSDANDETAQ